MKVAMRLRYTVRLWGNAGESERNNAGMICFYQSGYGVCCGWVMIPGLGCQTRTAGSWNEYVLRRNLMKGRPPKHLCLLIFLLFFLLFICWFGFSSPYLPYYTAFLIHLFCPTRLFIFLSLPPTLLPRSYFKILSLLGFNETCSFSLFFFFFYGLP